MSADQVKLAREVDLLSYLQANEPQELKPSAPGEYRTVTHGSLVISNGKWIWNRGGIGGRSALDYLVKVRGMGFVDAVETVLGSRAAPVSFSLPVEKAKTQQTRKAFELPPPTRFPAHALSYLQGRGISAKVIEQCLWDGTIYESRDKGKSVCVFVGKDESGVARFAHMRGIYEKYHRDADGSDKRFSFSIPAQNPDSHHLAVFEAPIDALSHATLQHRDGWRWDGHRLSLGGTSPVALISFLGRNPQIKRITLHLDNDAAGLIAARKIKAQLAGDNQFRRIRVSINPPRGAKDYNEALLRAVSMEREQKQKHRRKADIFI